MQCGIQVGRQLAQFESRNSLLTVCRKYLRPIGGSRRALHAGKLPGVSVEGEEPKRYRKCSQGCSVAGHPSCGKEYRT